MNNKTFTLIELLVVIAIIGILASILMPSLQKAREKTKRAVCKSNQKQMGYAAQMYADDNDDLFPNWEGKTDNVIDSNGWQGDGTRNVQYGNAKVVIGRTINQGYIEEAAAPGVIFCPSRNAMDRNSYPGSGSWTWSRWDVGTTEYSYQHRRSRNVSEVEPGDVYGSDLAIWDTHVSNGVNMGQMSVGDNVCHGSDYYNVTFFDMSVRGIIDNGKTLETNQYTNSPNRALNRLEAIANP